MINVYVLNTNFEVVGVVDHYESFIWTDRWNSYGDFELYTSFDYSIIQLCQQNYYLHINQSEHTMIIEGIEIETSSEDGMKLRITGRSLESILDRRIVWKEYTVTANTTFESAIKNLIDLSFGTSGVAPHPGNRTAKNREISNARKMTNLVYESSEDSYISGIIVEKTQYLGEVVYDVLLGMCEDVNNTIGWKITFDSQNHFVFKLYTGKDRSWQQTGYVKSMDSKLYAGKVYYTYNEQTHEYVRREPQPTDQRKAKNVTYYEEDPIRPYVIFSPDFDNIVNTDYIDNIGEMKNVTLVGGEETEVEGVKKRKTLIVGSASDLERREIFTDARDLRMEDFNEDGVRYNNALKTRGLNNLSENSRVTSYEGEVDATRQFSYGPDADFYMGDIVQISNEYGINGAARIIEWIISDSTEGIKIYPTFDAVQIIDETEEEEDDEDV